jgi:selenophosphate synthetase-related protein
LGARATRVHGEADVLAMGARPVVTIRVLTV